MPAPDASFSSRGVPAAERFDAYRAFMAGGFTRLRPTEAWRQSADAAGRRWRLDGVALSHLRHNGLVMQRPGASATRPGNDVLVVAKYLRGASEGRHGDACYRTVSGSVAISDVRKPIQARSHGPLVEMVTVALPFELIGYKPQRHGAGLPDEVTGPLRRLVDVSLNRLLAELPAATPAHATELADGFAGLIRSFLVQCEPGSTAHAALVRGRAMAIRHFIDDNLDRPALTVAEVCAAIGASRATVYRDLAENGGFERYVVRKRLSAALDELRRCPPRRGLVGEVAERWGFADQAHFAKLARQLAGVAPSEIIGVGA